MSTIFTMRSGIVLATRATFKRMAGYTDLTRIGARIRPVGTSPFPTVILSVVHSDLGKKAVNTNGVPAMNQDGCGSGCL